jgi:hypothetical protein
MNSFLVRQLTLATLTGGVLVAHASDCYSRVEAPTSREAWSWPFSSTSIWNMPIGSNARYQAANLPVSGVIGCDVEWHLRTTVDDPVVLVYAPSSWERRWPGEKKRPSVPLWRSR